MGFSATDLRNAQALDVLRLAERCFSIQFCNLGKGVERDLIRERMLARLKAAEARGRKGGRKPAALVASGLTVREAAARLKVGKATLYDGNVISLR